MKQRDNTADRRVATYDLDNCEARQFASRVSSSCIGPWAVISFHPSGVNIEGGLTLSDACVVQDRTKYPSFLFRVPEDAYMGEKLVNEHVNPKADLTFSFDVEDGEIVGGNFNIDGEVVVSLYPPTWKWSLG